jgi:hypothetical protein
MLLMAWNVVMTVRSGRPEAAAPAAPLPPSTQLMPA